MEATAKLKFARISSKKMQPIAKMVRGRSLAEAIAVLQFTPKKGAIFIRKVIESARSNAAEKQMDVDTLKVKLITIDRGPMMYRMMTRQRGMAYRIRRRSVHISVTLGAA
ncbi:MAG: 50S ribosomal protein L22 [Deltaproteobacteria bacterium]|nr:50S ribosomal protein L22 [Deltaproteobacteria bacterium]